MSNDLSAPTPFRDRDHALAFIVPYKAAQAMPLPHFHGWVPAGFPSPAADWCWSLESSSSRTCSVGPCCSSSVIIGLHRCFQVAMNESSFSRRALPHSPRVMRSLGIRQYKRKFARP